MWKKGRSGNPRGRKPGTGSVAALREALAEHVPAIIESLVSAAKAGDTAAAKLILERVVPPLKSEELPVSLCGLKVDHAELIARVIEAIAGGWLDVDRGARLIATVTPSVTEQRIAKLERALQAPSEESES